MTVFDAEIPLSLWTVTALLIIGGVALVGHRTVAAWLGWRPRAALGILLILGATVAITLTPGHASTHTDLRSCVPHDRRALAEVGHLLGHDVENLLNWALFVPFAVFLQWTVRRARFTIPAVLFLPAVIEVVQVVVPGRLCAASDYVANIAGGLIAVFITAAIHRWKTSRGPRP